MSPFLLVMHGSGELQDEYPVPSEVVTLTGACKMLSRWVGRFRRRPSRNSRDILRAVRLCTCSETSHLLQLHLMME
jgi:hypothetical protein